MRKNFCVMILLIAVLLLAACGGGLNDRHVDMMAFDSFTLAETQSGWFYGDSAPGIPLDMWMAEAESELMFGAAVPITPSPTISPADADRHQATQRIIRNGVVTLISEPDDFDSTVEALRAIAPEAGGFVERSNLFVRENRTISGANRFLPPSQRIFTITLRVSVDTFEGVMQKIEGLAELRTSSHSSEDVTAQFYDITGRLETRRVEQERILALIDEADTVASLLTLETRLSQVNTQIAVYEAQLLSISGRAAYSSIFVELAEAGEEAVPLIGNSFGTRISTAFGNSADGTINFLQGTVIFFAGAFLPLLTIGGIGFAAFFVARRVNRKMNAVK